MKIAKGPHGFTILILTILSGMGSFISLLFLTIILFNLISPGSILPNIDLPVSFSVENVGLLNVNDAESINSKINEATGSLSLEKPMPELVVLSSMISFSWVALFTYVMFILRKLFQSANDGNPFTIQNGKRIKILAFIVFIAAIVISFFVYASNSFLLNHLEIESVTVSTNFNLNIELILLGFVLLAISELFKIKSA